MQHFNIVQTIKDFNTEKNVHEFSTVPGYTIIIQCKQFTILILCKLHHSPSNANILVVERHKILSVEGMADPRYNLVDAVSFPETVC